MDNIPEQKIPLYYFMMLIVQNIIVLFSSIPCYLINIIIINTKIVYPIIHKTSFSFIFLFRFSSSFFNIFISTAVFFCSSFNLDSALHIFFSASFCFFCAADTASTEEAFTNNFNLEFWSRTFLISSTIRSCSLLLCNPFLFLRSSLLC